MKTFSSAVVALLALGLSAFAGVDLGSASGRTPYDAYMQPVKQVLGSLSGTAPTLDRVQALMREGRHFRYSYTTPYLAAMPEVTARTKAGDCKAKALWMIDQLGDQNCRFVVGKASYGAKLSHAWVLWREQTSGQWYILDCTNASKAILADKVSRDQYIPLYSWSKGSAYSHAATQVGLAAVAGKRAPGVAAAY